MIRYIGMTSTMYRHTLCTYALTNIPWIPKPVINGFQTAGRDIRMSSFDLLLVMSKLYAVKLD